MLVDSVDLYFHIFTNFTCLILNRFSRFVVIHSLKFLLSSPYGRDTFGYRRHDNDWRLRLLYIEKHIALSICFSSFRFDKANAVEFWSHELTLAHRGL
jgi:hypothetical protein